MEKNSKIYVAGHNGMVGSAIVRKLKAEGHTNILTASSKEVNLINQAAVNEWFEANKPDYVFVAAARVGGINANNVYRADFFI
jgi:GDP-L-fucose synthase